MHNVILSEVVLIGHGILTKQNLIMSLVSMGIGFGVSGNHLLFLALADCFLMTPFPPLGIA